MLIEQRILQGEFSILFLEERERRSFLSEERNSGGAVIYVLLN